MRERWVVISKCQGIGLANSIQCLAKTIDCEACNPMEFERLLSLDPKHFLSYDFALILPAIRDAAIRENIDLPPHIVVPAFKFGAYHPDSTHLWVDGQAQDAWMGSYHSIIALAAYQEGLTAEQASDFFNAKIYRDAGYFDLWARQSQDVLRLFSIYGIDVRPVFDHTALAGPLMNTPNRPTIDVLFEISHAILSDLGRDMFNGMHPPVDEFAGFSWPIYPEIAEALGVCGAYLFQSPLHLKPLELLPYLQTSLHFFSRWHPDRLKTGDGRQEPLVRIREAMRKASATNSRPRGPGS